MRRTSIAGVSLFILLAALIGGLHAQEVSFLVRIENVSAGTSLPTPFSPGVWATHSDPDVLFTAGEVDRGLGLVSIAEDGNPAALGEALAGAANVFRSGVFNTPLGAAEPGPIFGGGVYEFSVTASPANRYLTLATMLVHSNDVFAAPSGSGVLLFDEADNPVSEVNMSAELMFWDVGSEVNEAPGMGPNQAPRQPAADTGASEGSVSQFTNTTRSLPIASGIVDVQVEITDGDLTVEVANVSGSRGSLVTPVAPVFFAIHDSSWSLFSVGEPATAGLEELAEDGSPAGLVGEHGEAPGVGMVGAQPITVERPEAEPGPALPGERYVFSLTPDASFPNLTLASMVVETNDVFMGFGPEGVALFDADGQLRSAAAISADIASSLAVWDAGTEANEVPGVGPNQAPRQAMGNTGPDDPTVGVRLYSDPTNDLAGPQAGGFVAVTIVPAAEPLTFDVTFTNSSDQTVYPGLLTPVAWALHDSSASFFMEGEPASVEIERLAEDGDPAPLVESLQTASGVLAAGVANTPDGSEEAGPLMPGNSYSFSVTTDAENPFLSLASMVVPSNDTFVAFDPSGIRLLSETGDPRTAEELTADVESQLRAWDAGTERNQAGAAGPDQAPRQSGPDTGAAEGDGTVRLLEDPVWSYPRLEDVLRVTVSRMDVEGPLFQRGDVNSDAGFDISDPVVILRHLFVGDLNPTCLKTADANDDSTVDMTDAMVLLSFLFLGDTPPAEPFGSCGTDPTDDEITCDSYAPCS